MVKFRCRIPINTKERSLPMNILKNINLEVIPKSKLILTEAIQPPIENLLTPVQTLSPLPDNNAPEFPQIFSLLMSWILLRSGSYRLHARNRLPGF